MVGRTAVQQGSADRSVAERRIVRKIVVERGAAECAGGVMMPLAAEAATGLRAIGAAMRGMVTVAAAAGELAAAAALAVLLRGHGGRP
jgi:hypothetical protein